MVTPRKQAHRTSRANTVTEHLLQALVDPPAKEQLALVSRTLIALLHSVRPRFGLDPERQQAFDLLYSDTLTVLRREIEALRFTKAEARYPAWAYDVSPH